MRHRSRTSLLLCALFGILVACGGGGASAPATTPATSVPARTGPLTEEQFKALHELPAAGPQDTRGTEIKVNGQRAYLSLPAGTGPFPVIVVIHEWWGLNKNIEHWADRLATAGWAAIAVDLYGGVVATDRDAALAALKKVDDAQAHATIAAAFQYAADDPRIRATKRAVIGWCFGGGWALQTALATANLDGAIVYYGQLEQDPAKLRAIKGQLLGIFGRRDDGIPTAEVEKFDAALSQAGVRHQIKLYDAEHAFANPSNTTKYDAVSAADAWQHVIAFLGDL